MNINWQVRFKNKTFWLTFIPALFLVIQTVASVFGFTLDLTELQADILEVINAIFALLAVLGVVVDNTTKGISDSSRAMTYKEPN